MRATSTPCNALVQAFDRDDAPVDRELGADLRHYGTRGAVAEALFALVWGHALRSASRGSAGRVGGTARSNGQTVTVSSVALDTGAVAEEDIVGRTAQWCLT